MDHEGLGDFNVHMSGKKELWTKKHVASIVISLVVSIFMLKYYFLRLKL